MSRPPKYALEDGTPISIREMEERSGVKHGTLQHRLEMGMTPEEAMDNAVARSKRKRGWKQRPRVSSAPTYEMANGARLTLRQIAERAGVGRGTIKYRMKHGMTPDEAIRAGRHARYPATRLKFELNGKKVSIMEAADALRLTHTTFYERAKRSGRTLQQEIDREAELARTSPYLWRNGKRTHPGKWRYRLNGVPTPTWAIAEELHYCRFNVFTQRAEAHGTTTQDEIDREWERQHGTGERVQGDLDPGGDLAGRPDERDREDPADGD